MKNQKDITAEEVKALLTLVIKGYAKAIEETGWARGCLFDLRKKHKKIYDAWKISFDQDPEAFLKTHCPEPMPRDQWPMDLTGLRALITEPVHPAADKMELWPVEMLHAAAENLIQTKHRIGRIRLLKSTGEILDGRNTLIIWRLAGFEPLYEGVELPLGMTPEAYVEQCNVLRRQLTKDQKAARAALEYCRLRELGKALRERNLRRGQIILRNGISSNSESNLVFLSRLYGASTKYIQYATAILEHSQEVFDRVLSGALPLVEGRRECGFLPPKKVRTDTDGEAGSSKTTAKAAPASPTLSSKPGNATPEGADRRLLLAFAKLVVQVCNALPVAIIPRLQVLSSVANRIVTEFS